MPDGNDWRKAAALELIMVNENPGVPVQREVDYWLNISKGMSATESDVAAVTAEASRLYHDEAIRRSVIAPLARRSQTVLREQDAIWAGLSKQEKK